jgi:hypothetical protein
MQLSHTATEYRFIGLGALLGALVTMAVGAAMMGRKHRIAGYLHQSGEQSGTCPSEIQKHDEQVYRGAVAAEQS